MRYATSALLILGTATTAVMCSPYEEDVAPAADASIPETATTPDADAGVPDAPVEADIDPSCRSRPFGVIAQVKTPLNIGVGITSFRLVAADTAYISVENGVVYSYTIDAKLDAVTNAAEVVLSGATRSHPCVFAGNNALVFSNTTSGLRNLLLASRTPDQTAWATATALDLVQGQEELEPWVVEPSGRLYLTVSTVPLQNEIYSASRKGAAWENALPVGGLSSSSNDGAPVVTCDERVIFFSSSRESAEVDIWTAQRAGINVPFETPTRAMELSQPSVEERPSWLSLDGCVLVFTRKTQSTITVWRATR